MAMNRRGFITSAVAGLAAGAAGGALAARSEMGLFAPAQGNAIVSGNEICTTWKIQEADRKAWNLFDDAGTEVTRLSREDVERFTELAVPLWITWANKDKGAARIFKVQLDYKMSGSLGYVESDMIKATNSIGLDRQPAVRRSLETYKTRSSRKGLGVRAAISKSHSA